MNLPVQVAHLVSTEAAVALCLVIQSSSALAQSFPCSNASSSVEWTICKSSALANLDLSLAKAFKNAVMNLPDRRVEMIDAQRGWLTMRNERCGKDRMRGDPTILGCLKSTYEARIRNLAQEAEAGHQEVVDQDSGPGHELPRISTDFLGIKRFLAEFYRDKFEDCGHILSADELADPTNLFDVLPVRLDLRGTYGYVSTPLGACFAGAANTDLMVLMPTRRGYKILAERIAQTVNVLPQSTNGFFDIEFEMHGGANESTHFGYKYNGSRYLKSSCADWTYPMSEPDDPEDSSQNPVVTLCK